MTIMDKNSSTNPIAGQANKIGGRKGTPGRSCERQAGRKAGGQAMGYMVTLPIALVKQLAEGFVKIAPRAGRQLAKRRKLDDRRKMTEVPLLAAPISSMLPRGGPTQNSKAGSLLTLAE
ncbi:MAG: hypothetical protein HYR84_04785 [Planctomycetes bacterium]|nr:hypothetical protein [Planctomycetota bacterium]